MMQIYLARNNVQAGPYTLEQLNAMLASGEVYLSDLIWHVGMENWKTVGEVTGGKLLYQPNANRPMPQINLTPTTHHQPNWLKKDNSQKGIDVSHARKQLDLASIPSRIFASLIDFFLFILSLMPLSIALINSPSFAKLESIVASGQTKLTTAQQAELLAVIPDHILLLTNLLVWGLLIAQILLLVKRGQTLGKMAMGIRILDINSNAIPTITNIILLRTILINVIYTLSTFGLFFFIIDILIMLTNKNRQSLHDKLAKTYVVRADDTQTTPLKLEAQK